MRKTANLLSSTALLCCLISAPAFAGDSEKIAQLEAQLEKAMQMIEAQSKQMSILQKEVKALKSAENEKVAAAEKIDTLEKDLVTYKAASIQPSAGTTPNASLEQRVTEMEDIVYDLDEKVGSETLANAFDASNLDIGGFVNTAFTYVDGEDGSAAAWNRQNFELLIRADLDDQWSAFFAGGFIREGNVGFDDDQDGTLNEAGERRNPDFAIEPGVAGGTKNPQIIAWVNYKHNDALNLKLGRLITPHGIINIEHFPATLLDQEQPLFLRPFGGQTIFPNFTTGAQVHGQFFFGDDMLSYNAYSASAQSAAEELIHGGRVAYNFGDEGVTVGLNAATGSRTEGTNGDYTLAGADLLIDRGPVLWKSEIFTTDEENAPGRLAYYTQPAWRFNDQWIGFYRYDFLDDGANGSAAVPDNAGDVTEHMVGINFLPKPSVRLRLTGTRREYGATGSFGKAEADIFQFSTTYSF